MEQIISSLSIATPREGFINITSEINHWIVTNKINKGILVLFVQHTSCSLTINENADPRVLEDLSTFMKALVPEEGINPMPGRKGHIPYKHSEEGADDMPAHIKTSLTCSSLTLSIDNCKLNLGTWQAIYLWEHRSQKHSRKIILHAIGEIQNNNQPSRPSSKAT